MKITEHTFALNGKLSERKKTSEIILHCSATAEGKDYTVDSIDKWHKAREFTCIGYQFVIYRDGTVHRGRKESAVGAHCTGHNAVSIGICYIGGCDAQTGKGKDTRTPQQKEAMYQLVSELMQKYNIPAAGIHGHREFANKSCPCFTADAFRKELSAWKAAQKKAKEHKAVDCECPCHEE